MESKKSRSPKRVIVVFWKDGREDPLEVYSNLKKFSDLHPEYTYGTLNNYLSKKGIPFESSVARIERLEIK